ncbi:hypothetical protein ACWDA3_00045 [Nonomuraea rubra]
MEQRTLGAGEPRIATLRGALDAGITFIGTAGHYGMGHNETPDAIPAFLQRLGTDYVDICRPARLDTIEQVAGERYAPALLSLLDSERTGGRR